VDLNHNMKTFRLSILVFAIVAFVIAVSHAVIPECQETAHCKGKTEMAWKGRPVPFCDTDVHLCVGCINDADCEDNEFCLSPYGTCYNKDDNPGDTSEMPSNCTDMNPPEYCKKMAIKMDRFLVRDNHCNITLMNWIEKLSEKEVCYDNDMMPEKNTRMDDLDDRMEPCKDESNGFIIPMHQCTENLKKLDTRWQKWMEKNCSMTAGIMTKHLMTIKKPKCLLKGQD